MSQERDNKLLRLKAESQRKTSNKSGKNNNQSANINDSKKKKLPNRLTTTTNLGPSNMDTNKFQASKSIKKAHVRFDDYLDLNEENMRRSCKRLMNHLYSESTTTPPPIIALAPAMRCSGQVQPVVSKCLATQQQQGAPMQANCCASGASKDGYEDEADKISIELNNSTLPNLTASQQQTNAISTGKSYLRSQYERRQLRQMELAGSNKEERSKKCIGSRQIANGANARRQQQDLVAKSHELSKRRFFERLERRKSMKSPNLKNATTATTEAATAPTTTTSSSSTNNQPMANQMANERQNADNDGKDGCKQKSLADDEELMLKVYQSIVMKGEGTIEVGQDQDKEQKQKINRRDSFSLGSPAGASIATAEAAKESVDELIGFYTPSPQSVAVQRTKPLIELSSEQECFSKLVAASENQSAYEIKVPEQSANFSSDSLEQQHSTIADGFISSGLLVVKQVRMADSTECSKLLLETADVSSGPPSSSGRHNQEENTSTRLMGNKTLSTKSHPLVDDGLADNKVISVLVGQINGQKEECTLATMVVESSQTTSAGNSEQSSSIGGDNQESQSSGVIAAISNRNSNNTSNKMKTILSEEAAAIGEQTTGYGGSGKLDKLKSFSLIHQRQQQQQQQQSIEGCGESNCAKDHEAPETRLLVEQSGGADAEAYIAGASEAPSEETNANVAHPVRIKSAAAQAQQVASLKAATITKTEIRDVLPGANEINRIEAIVSGQNDGTAARAAATAAPFEKVTISSEQVNEGQEQSIAQIETTQQQQRLNNEDKYANGSADEKGTRENNVTYIVSGGIKKSDVKSGNVDLNGESRHLIEPYSKHANLIPKQSTSSVEEDGGSSCSSSGFGASGVSVASSSDACSGGDSVINDAACIVESSKRELGEFKRPTSLAIIAHLEATADTNPLYDKVRIPRNRDHIQKATNEFPDHKKLVGPDQAYPRGRNSPVLAENHSYASVSNRCDFSRLDANIVLERDDLVEGYANWPRRKASPVEYATVRSTLRNRLDESHSDETLSGQSHSTSSTTNSGGFSALPPVRLECPSSNNFKSLVSLSEGPQRKFSLLKRFGSLVSKAFTITNAQSVPSKTKELSDDPQEQSQKRAQGPHENESTNNSNNNSWLKSALVIEKDRQVANQVRVSEADLVILPTKHVNQRKPAQEQNLITRRHDDRMSRENKRHSRKMKQTDSSSVSSSFSSSSSSSSLSNIIRNHKRADSLSEELESLMSRSESSSNYRRTRENRAALTQRRAVSSNLRKPVATATTKGHIDIDCVSPPARRGAQTDSNGRVNSATAQTALAKSGSPSSLLNLFNSNGSQRAVESTPNLSSSSSSRKRQQQTCRHPSGKYASGGADHVVDAQQPISGFWGFSSLIGHSHATTEQATNAKSKPKVSRKSRTKASLKPDAEIDPEYRDSLTYSNLQPFAAGYKLHLGSALQGKQQTLDKYQSLNLYQNLLRNYAKRRHHCLGHHLHHHHRAHHSSPLSRHAHNSTKCSQNCGQNCHLSALNSEHSYDGGKNKTVVWGQLIKINKSDGSQVIELQRMPGKPWGFFVARGAIENVKGIFISRMHDNETSDSLTGLLSIGDRILAIDDCTIGPDYDILRVNQLISKKSKILLKVKPFKG